MSTSWSKFKIFKLSAEEHKDTEESKKMKLLKKFKGKQMIFFKRVSGGMDNYNIIPKVYKSQKGNVILNSLKI